MKRTFTQSLLAVFLSLLTLNVSIAAKAIFANEPFTCNDGIAYQTINSTADNTSGLHGFDIATGVKTLIATLPFHVNGLIYNSVDNMLWAFELGTNNIVRIDKTGGTTSYPVPNLPSDLNLNVGAELPGGYMLLYSNNTADYFVVDVNPGRATYLQLVDPTAGFVVKTGPNYGTAMSSPLAVSDIAFVSKDQLCYGITRDSQIATLDPFTGNVVIGAAVDGLPSSGNYGAIFSDVSGKLYVFHNGIGSFSMVDPATNAASLISTSAPSGNNDGASCANTTLVDLPFTCANGITYQVAGGGSNSSLYAFDVATGTRTLIAPLPYPVNGLIYNSVDNMLWGYINGTNSIVRIDREGGVVAHEIPNLPGGFNIGVELPNGYMMLSTTNNAHYYVVDLDPNRATYLQLVDPTAGFVLKTGPNYGTAVSAPLDISDIAFVSGTQLGYGITLDAKIASLNPLTGSVVVSETPVTGLPIAGYGAVVSDATGRLYAFHNPTGAYYRIDIASNSAKLISTVTPSGNNDGASCANTLMENLPFTCENGITYQVAAAGGNPSSLYAFNVVNGTRTLIAPLPYVVNGLVYNSVDNMLWASINNTNSIVRIDREGGVVAHQIANLPSGFNIGVELPNGYMMLSSSNNAYYYVVDIDATRSTYLQLVDPTAGFVLKTGPNYGTAVSALLDISDIAFVSSTQLGYGITLDAKVASLNPLTGSVVVSETPVTGLPIAGYGAVVSDVTGRLYAFHNPTGAYYRIDIASNSAKLISTITPSGGNDGASCANTLIENLPFTCDDGTTYQVAAGGGNSSSLYAFNVSSGNRTLIAPMPFTLNGLVYNSADDMLWASINNTNRIVRIDKEGGVVAHQIANLPSGFNIGVELPNGYMMLTSSNNAHYYVVDIDATRSTYLQLVDPTAGFVLKTGPNFGTAVSAPLDISDIAFVSSKQLCYGITLDAKLASLNPLTGNVVVSETSVNGLPNAGYGAVVTDASGNLYAFNNSTGGFYKIDIASNTANIINTFAPSGNNDGANCSTATLCDVPYAPVISQNTVVLICPVITADLTALVTSTTPSGSTLAFYTNATPSAESLVGDPTKAIEGTYYAVYSNAGCALSTKIIVSGCALPVTLVSFTLTKEESIVLLNWATTEETNSELFQIERCQDGKSWRQIGTTPAQGESSVLKNYQFVDASPLKGGNYYRLKMVDKDGTFSYSRIQFGEFAKANELIYPNPASQSLFFTNHKEIQDVAIYSPIGVKVLNAQTISSAGVDVRTLSPGMYIAVLTLIDGSTHAQKVVIVK